MYTTSQYEILKSAIAQGALKVEYGDKKIEYRSLSEMLLIKAAMEAELFPNTCHANRKYASFSKGIK